MSFSAQQSFSGTAGAAQTITFGYAGNNTPIRYAYFAVQNTGTTGNLYVRTDGTAASTTGGDFNMEVGPGQLVVVANELATWSQAASVIPASAAGAGAYTNASGNGPLGVTPMGTSPYGQLASPGSSVSIASAGTPTFTVSGSG